MLEMAQLVEEVFRGRNTVMAQLVEVWVEFLGGQLTSRLLCTTHKLECLAEQLALISKAWQIYGAHAGNEVY